MLLHHSDSSRLADGEAKRDADALDAAKRDADALDTSRPADEWQ